MGDVISWQRLAPGHFPPINPVVTCLLNLWIIVRCRNQRHRSGPLCWVYLGPWSRCWKQSLCYQSLVFACWAAGPQALTVGFLPDKLELGSHVVISIVPSYLTLHFLSFSWHEMTLIESKPIFEIAVRDFSPSFKKKKKKVYFADNSKRQRCPTVEWREQPRSLTFS